MTSYTVHVKYDSLIYEQCRC